jgi:hypothetical protein
MGTMIKGDSMQETGLTSDTDALKDEIRRMVRENKDKLTRQQYDAWRSFWSLIPFGSEWSEIADEVRLENEYSSKKWGDEFDAQNTPNDWVAYVAMHAGRAVTYPWDAAEFRKQMIKVANIAITAASWCDRTLGAMAPRHYDEHVTFEVK